MRKKNNKSFSFDVRKTVWDKTSGRCWYCGKTLITNSPNQYGGNDHFVIEHVENFGGDDISNLVPACGECNRAKKQRSLEEFREYINKPSFNERQIKYLKKHGIEIPEPKERYVFYGEML